MNNSFFLIGLPKAGTTSLFSWLQDHPEIQASEPKETFFFMDSTHPLAGRAGRSLLEHGSAAFGAFFEDAASNNVYIEGTTHAFYQQVARHHITAMESTLGVGILLREPSARLLSSFRFTRDNLVHCDRSLTFDRYVDCLLKGKTNRLDRYYRSEASLWIAKRELELGKYVRWIDWWLERVARDRFRLMLFEQLCHDPRKVVAELCCRLGIESAFYNDYDFGQLNRTYAVGQPAIHRIIRGLARLLPGGGAMQYTKSLYLEWQRKSATPDADYAEGLDRIRRYFAPFNRELEGRYDLDLMGWWGVSALRDA